MSFKNGIESNILDMNPVVENDKKDIEAVDSQMNTPEAFDSMKMRLDAAALHIAGIRDYVEQMNSPEVAQQAKQMLESEDFKVKFAEDSDKATLELLEIAAQPELKRLADEAVKEIEALRNNPAVFKQAA